MSRWKPVNSLNVNQNKSICYVSCPLQRQDSNRAAVDEHRLGTCAACSNLPRRAEVDARNEFVEQSMTSFISCHNHSEKRSVIRSARPVWLPRGVQPGKLCGQSKWVCTIFPQRVPARQSAESEHVQELLQLRRRYHQIFEPLLSLDTVEKYSLV